MRIAGQVPPVVSIHLIAEKIRNEKENQVGQREGEFTRLCIGLRRTRAQRCEFHSRQQLHRGQREPDEKHYHNPTQMSDDCALITGRERPPYHIQQQGQDDVRGNLQLPSAELEGDGEPGQHRPSPTLCGNRFLVKKENRRQPDEHPQPEGGIFQPPDDITVQHEGDGPEECRRGRNLPFPQQPIEEKPGEKEVEHHSPSEGGRQRKKQEDQVRRICQSGLQIGQERLAAKGERVPQRDDTFFQ